MRVSLFCCLAMSIGCASQPAAVGTEPAEPSSGGQEPEAFELGAAPPAQLPDDVVPRSYRLSLEVVPDRERFSGQVWIRARASAPTRHIWLHAARRMNVSGAEIQVVDQGASTTTVAARWEPSTEREELGAVIVDRAVSGDIEIHLTFDAPFDRQLKGLYRVDVGTDSYAFTQFEATSARYAFPCFDEPRFKTPFDIELVVRSEHVAIANTREVGATELEGGLRRVQYATTLPLPTYLVALAVGPLDVVEAPAIAPNAVRDRALPFRGIAARGRGAELAHALSETPRLLRALEDYFGTEYPYDKLDVIAVPDFAAGAMENAGAITFRESLLLIGGDPPADQLRAFTNVMAHELAHQWFGNLVTMPWWDDIWLNEAFATWMASKIVAATHPEMSAELGQLAAIHGAMGADSLAATRQIRQPIESDHDIRNAFDAITYQKGAGVLSMFEQWMGEDVFREGVRLYLRQHRFETATSNDLLLALSEVSGRDVMTPFRTFLEQPGVPLIEATISCEGAPVVAINQSRYTPVGSSAERDRLWSAPVCVLYPSRGSSTEVACELVTEAHARIPLPEGTGCPAWVMPNAGARGYYRWMLPARELGSLLDRGLPRLSVLERASLANNLRAAFASAVLPASEIMERMPRLAGDSSRSVATEPMALASAVIEMVPDEHVERARGWAASLYAARAGRLGWSPRPTESQDDRLLRRDVLAFLTLVGRHPRARAEAVRRAQAFFDGSVVHRDAVSPDLAGIALAAAVQELGAQFSEPLDAHLTSETDAIIRARILTALASTDDPALLSRALGLALDPRLRVAEVLIPLSVATERREVRSLAWQWAQEHWDALAARAATTRVGAIPLLFSGFCDQSSREQVQSFFEPRVRELPGGPRNLMATLEAIDLCIARGRAQADSAVTFLATGP